MSQTFLVNSDHWVATDALGRKLPESSETGDRNNKLVGIFYWTWHQQDGPGNREPHNLTDLPM